MGYICSGVSVSYSIQIIDTKAPQHRKVWQKKKVDIGLGILSAKQTLVSSIDSFHRNPHQ